MKRTIGFFVLITSLSATAMIGVPNTSVTILSTESEIQSEIKSIQLAALKPIDSWVNTNEVLEKLSKTKIFKMTVTTSSFLYSYEKGAEESKTYEMETVQGVLKLVVSATHNAAGNTFNKVELSVQE